MILGIYLIVQWRRIVMIKVNNLLINKGTFQLGPIDLELEKGYVYAITGNSGSG